MKVKTDIVINDFDGEPLKIDGKVLLLRIALFTILNYENHTKGEDFHVIDAGQKIRNYKLIVDLNNDEVQLKSDDITYIKKVGAMIYAPIVFGQVMLILEPDEPEDAKETK